MYLTLYSKEIVRIGGLNPFRTSISNPSTSILQNDGVPNSAMSPSRVTTSTSTVPRTPPTWSPQSDRKLDISVQSYKLGFCKVRLVPTERRHDHRAVPIA